MKQIIVLTLLLLASFGNAQNEKKSYSFTLDEAITHALQNNYSAINASRDIDAAKKKEMGNHYYRLTAIKC